MIAKKSPVNAGRWRSGDFFIPDYFEKEIDVKSLYLELRILYWNLRLKWAKAKKWFYDLPDWIYFHEPIFCAVCEKIVIRNNTKIVQPLTGGTVRICEECYKIHFPDGEK